MQANDNGKGQLVLPNADVIGSIDYRSRVLTFNPIVMVKVPYPRFGMVAIGTTRGETKGYYQQHTSVTTQYRYQMSSLEQIDLPAVLPPNARVTVRFRTNAGNTAARETFKVKQVRFDLTPRFAETILQGSVRFVCGDKTYVDRLGSLYHSINPANGAGILAGAVQYESGIVTLDDWQPLAQNALRLQSLVTEFNVQPVDEVVFRIPIAPVRVGSVQIRAVPIEGNNGQPNTVTADANGKIQSAWMMGKVDYQTGVVRIQFGQKVNVTSEIMAAPWYKAETVFTENGVNKTIWPRPVFADTIRYNAVGYTYLPLSADILGLDPVRLPSDGRVPIYRTGEVIVVHHTDQATLPERLHAGLVFDVGRVRVSHLKLLDAKGKPVDPAMYKTDLEAGSVVLTSQFNATGLTFPLHAEHRIEDMAVVTDVQIHGRLALNKPLTHHFPVANTVVSSALYVGDLQARVYAKFSQVSWTNVWSDSLIGDATTAQYNDTLYPITTSNKGAAQEQWLIQFTSNTAFRVVGRAAGQIATGDINTDLKPQNPATGVPYFVLKALGWGGGWAAGNVLRFNTAAANFPFWMIRTVLQGPATQLSDGFQIQARGDVDR